MNKWLLLTLTISSNGAYAMQPTGEEFRQAIITGDKAKIKEYLREPFPLSERLGNEHPRALTVALRTKNEETTRYLAEQLSSKIEEATVCFLDAFLDIEETGDEQSLRTLMSCKMPYNLKTRRCQSLLDTACDENYVQVARLLVSEYSAYVKAPVSSASFQRSAVCHPEEHKEVVEVILHHPRAVSGLENLLYTGLGMTYKKQKKRYKELLTMAKRFAADKNGSQ